MPKYKCQVHGENVPVFPPKTVKVDDRACALCMNVYFSRTYPVKEMVEEKKE